MALIRYDNITFASNSPLAAADYNALIRNARIIDALSYRGRRAFTSASIKWAYEFGASPTVVSRGSFQYRTGVTNLNLVVDATFPGGGTHTLQIYLNGTLRYSATWASGRASHFVAINGLGYSDLDIIDMEVRDSWTGAPGNTVVIDAYIDAMSGGPVGSYPSPSSFGALSLSNLSGLMAAQQWCIDRLTQTDQMTFMGPMFITGLAYPTSQEALLFDGSISYSNGAGILTIGLAYDIASNQAEQVVVRIDGTTVATQGFTLGQAGEIEFGIDISAYTPEQILRLTIVQQVVTAPVSGARQIGSRYTITDIYTRRATYPVPTLPADGAPLQAMTFSTLQTNLNQIVTATTNAANRIGSAIDVFNRQRVFRWRPGVDDGQNTYYADVLVAKGRRAGDALWVYGKGVTISWGPLTVTPKVEGLYEWKGLYEQQVIPGDSYQTKIIYFDNLAGLDPGVAYWVHGADIRYVAEQVR